MRICTWNVNSVRLRTDHIGRLLRAARPDVLCLQETKVTNESFPLSAFTRRGFTHHLVHGMKGYNGGAIACKYHAGIVRLKRVDLQPAHRSEF